MQIKKVLIVAAILIVIAWIGINIFAASKSFQLLGQVKEIDEISQEQYNKITFTDDMDNLFILYEEKGKFNFKKGDYAQINYYKEKDKLIITKVKSMDPWKYNNEVFIKRMQEQNTKADSYLEQNIKPYRYLKIFKSLFIWILMFIIGLYAWHYFKKRSRY